jgi:hypothetical protein
MTLEACNSGYACFLSSCNTTKGVTTPLPICCVAVAPALCAQRLAGGFDARAGRVQGKPLQ